jgi:hypothetical protein
MKRGSINNLRNIISLRLKSYVDINFILIRLLGQMPMELITDKVETRLERRLKAFKTKIK